MAASSSTAASATSAAVPNAPAARPPYSIALLATPAAFPMAAMTLPAEMEGTSGTVGQALQISPSLAARLPPMNTLDEPVSILNHATGSPQQVGARPISSHRAAGRLLMSTRTQLPSVDIPKLGRGTGGAGGMKLGGCICACGVPRYGDMSVAAGRLGQTAEIGAVKLANPTSNACFARPRVPIIAPTVCCVARITRAAFSPALGKCSSGWPLFTGALMSLHALFTLPTDVTHSFPTPSMASGVLAARVHDDVSSPVTPSIFWLTASRSLSSEDGGVVCNSAMFPFSMR